MVSTLYTLTVTIGGRERGERGERGERERERGERGEREREGGRGRRDRGRERKKIAATRICHLYVHFDK